MISYAGLFLNTKNRAVSLSRAVEHKLLKVLDKPGVELKK